MATEQKNVTLKDLPVYPGDLTNLPKITKVSMLGVIRDRYIISFRSDKIDWISYLDGLNEKSMKRLSDIFNIVPEKTNFIIQSICNSYSATYKLYRNEPASRQAQQDEIKVIMVYSDKPIDSYDYVEQFVCEIPNPGALNQMCLNEKRLKLYNSYLSD